MEGCALTVRGDDPDRLPAAFVETKASEADRSLNRRSTATAATGSSTSSTTAAPPARTTG
jgi:hypothetical protein